jgi:hypothetical protein
LVDSIRKEDGPISRPSSYGVRGHGPLLPSMPFNVFVCVIRTIARIVGPVTGSAVGRIAPRTVRPVARVRIVIRVVSILIVRRATLASRASLIVVAGIRMVWFKPPRLDPSPDGLFPGLFSRRRIVVSPIRVPRTEAATCLPKIADIT